jgi:VWFA-related protein
VTTNAVVVDVVVTKGSGEPVLSLQKQDFAVTEDGKPQTIDFFEEHTSKALPADAPSPSPEMPPNVFTNVPPTPESDAVNVFLIDTLNTDRRDQIYVHKQILEFLRNMQPGTRAAIFVLGSRLRFVQGFTTDTAVLRAALEDKKNGFTAQKDITWRSREDNADDRREVSTLAMMQTSAAGLEAIRESQSDFANFQLGERVSMTLEALNYLARYLAGVPGRKNLIWFASSFPVTIFPSASQSHERSGAHTYTNAIRQTADLMKVSRIALYPISAEGTIGVHGMDADKQGPQPQSGAASDWAEAAEHANAISAMEKLASDTGGKAFYNSNDLGTAVNRAINDGSYYYTIVYSPTNKKMDGKYRRIEVKLAEGKYKLAYRRGYIADNSPIKESQTDPDPLRPLLMRGLPSATQLLYRVRARPADPQPGPRAARAGKNSRLADPVTRYNIDFMIRWSDLKLNNVTSPADLESGPGAQGLWHVKLSIEVMAYDRDGKLVNALSATPEMSLKTDTYAAVQKAGMLAHMEIDLPRSDVDLETGIYDWGSGKAGTLGIPLHVAAATATAAAQGTPKTE